MSSPQKKEKKPTKITELKANPQAKVDGLKLKEVQNKMDEANKFLSDNSSKFTDYSVMLKFYPRISAIKKALKYNYLHKLQYL